MRTSKRVSVVAGGTAALFGIGVAFAAWTSTGTGTASVTAGGEVDLVVEQVGSASGLYPTGSVDVAVKVTNNNPYPVSLAELAWDLSVTDNDAEACDEAAAIESVVLAEGETLGDYVAGNGSVDNDFTVTMDADADADCQGATFVLGFDASADSTDVQP